jgi:hypothetical protein
MVPLIQSLSTKLYIKFPPEAGQQVSAKFREEIERIVRKFLPGLTFTGSLPKEADAHYAGRGVSLGAADKPIFWYRPKDAKKYRVVSADLSVRDADAPPNVPVAGPEEDLVDALRYYTELSGGPFPDSADEEAFGQVLVVLMKKFHLQKGQAPSAKQMPEVLEAGVKIQPGIAFLKELPSKADAHYAGKGVSLGAADKPIFWYRPKDSKKYRVIYDDLLVRDADAPPNVPNAQRLPTTSILRYTLPPGPASPKK